MALRTHPATFGRRRVRIGIVLGVMAATVILPTAAYAAAGPHPPPAAVQQEVVDTPYGPLGPADRELLVKVRQAGLWEIPAGALAAERGSTPELREIGHHIHVEHIDLDEQTVAAAAELGVPLPDQPHADHQVWLDRMDELEGEEFDRFFVQVLREAHGVIFPIIADVRAGTRNDLVREFAEVGLEFVGRHLGYLESSGLVEWESLRPPAEPSGTQSRFLAANPAGVHPALVWLLLATAAIAGGVTFARTVRPR